MLYPQGQAAEKVLGPQFLASSFLSRVECLPYVVLCGISALRAQGVGSLFLVWVGALIPSGVLRRRIEVCSCVET